MTSGDDDPLFAAAKIAATEPAPVDPLARLNERFDGLEIDVLAAYWGRIRRCGLKERTSEIFEAEQYFDHLPHDDPRRAFAMALEILRTETDLRVRLELNDRLMTALVHRHAETLIGDFEAEAANNPDLRWLLGGLVMWADEVVRPRFAAIADKAAWDADYERARTPDRVIDYTGLSIDELAHAWVEQKSKPSMDCDDNWYALMDYEHDLAAEDPEKLVDLALALLKIETDPNILGLFAAGPLEDAVGHATIDRIEQEAAADERFRQLLGGVWYSSEPDDIKARLDAIFARAAGQGA